jgi:exonuclease III
MIKIWRSALQILGLKISFACSLSRPFYNSSFKISKMVHDLDLDEYEQQMRRQKNIMERIHRRRNVQSSLSIALTSTPSQNIPESGERRTFAQAKCTKLNHNRNEEQEDKVSPKIKENATSHQKYTKKEPIEEEKMSSLRASFHSGSDSDDDPVAALKKRQISARNTKRGLVFKSVEKAESVEGRVPVKMNEEEKSPASFQLTSDETSEPLTLSLEPKVKKTKKTVTTVESVGEINFTESLMDDTKAQVDVEAEADNNAKVCKDSTAETTSSEVKNAAAMMEKDGHEEDDDDTVSFTIVSWNISSAESSKVAPDPALRAAIAPQLIREEIMRSQPDVIALQETAYQSFGEKFATSFGYVSVGSQKALHTSEYVVLLVKRELANSAKQISFQSFEMHEIPAVAAIFTLPNRTRIAIASLHLPHTKEAAPFRQLLCNAIMEQLTSQLCEGVILVGDFNMRDFEDTATEKLNGGDWVDAWKEATNSNKKTKFTWNSRENKYHGSDNFSWTCRLDRCYVKSPKVAVKHFGLIGNRPIDGKEGDYLSDHYGIVVKCIVASSGAAQQDNEVILLSC